MESTERGLSVQNTTEAVFEAIKQMIVTGVLPPGGKIRQMELADRLQVSRTPLVKALHKLETSGFVRSIQGRGFYVHQVNVKEVLDLYALREALDSMIALDICGHFPPELIAELEESFEAVSPSRPDFDRRRYWEVDRHFHETLLRVSKNEFAHKVEKHFQVYNRTFLAGLPRDPSETLPEHREILDALRTGDPQRVQDAMVVHIRRTKEYLQEAISRLLKMGVDPSMLPIEEISFRKNEV